MHVLRFLAQKLGDPISACTSRPVEEQEMAEKGLAEDLEAWPKY